MIDIIKLNPHVVMKGLDREMNLSQDKKLKLFEANWNQYRNTHHAPLIPVEEQVS